MGDESEGLGGIVFTQGRLGIGEGLEVGLALMGAPFHEHKRVGSEWRLVTTEAVG